MAGKRHTVLSGTQEVKSLRILRQSYGGDDDDDARESLCTQGTQSGRSLSLPESLHEDANVDHGEPQSMERPHRLEDGVAVQTSSHGTRQ